MTLKLSYWAMVFLMGRCIACNHIGYLWWWWWWSEGLGWVVVEDVLLFLMFMLHTVTSSHWARDTLGCIKNCCS